MTPVFRIRSLWPNWLVRIVPACLALLVIGYEFGYQTFLNPTRPLAIFFGEMAVFGIMGPVAAWLLLRRLALDSAARRAAAEQINTLVAEEGRRSQELAALFAVSAAIGQALSEDEALTLALGRVLDVLHLESGKIYLLDAATGGLTLVSAQGLPPLLKPDEMNGISGECLCALTAPTGNLHQSVDPGSDPGAMGGRYQHSDYACATIPLPAKERTLGILHLASRREGSFSDSDVALLRSIGAQIGVAVENMRLREEARRAEALSTLIQEMHHRIKNNLQTVADLLSLEMSASPSPAARKSLRDSIGRIKSIAAVHELLSLEQLRLTDITELARQVCDISLRQMVRPDQRVTAEIGGPAIYLPSKQATALALVMNELIANALEHAFSLNSRDGRLMINLTQDGVQVTVSIADNGRGLPPDFDLTGRRGLGLQIVRTLVTKDLAGTLHLGNRPEGGSCATLTFYK